MEKGKNNAILLTVIGIATLLIAIVGATFAYFSAQTTYNDNASTLTVQTSNGGTTSITGGEDITVNNIYPVDGVNWLTKTYSIAYSNSNVDSSFTNPYTITLVYNNGFSANALTYTFEQVAVGTQVCTNSSSDGQPLATTDAGCGDVVSSTSNGTMATSVTTPVTLGTGSGNVTLGNGTFRATTSGQTARHTYLLKIQFPNGAGNQNVDQGKTFTAYITTTFTNS